MADWFKFFEDFFDHPRFQYAIHQLPEVCSVTVRIMCEHCKHKSRTIAWTGDEVDLLGMSAQINISPGKIVEAVKLLEKIKFVEIGENTLTFLKWNDLQSEYCKRKYRKNPKYVRTVSEHHTDTVRTVSGIEERRGEEKRVEEMSEAPTNGLLSFQEAFVATMNAGIPEDFCRYIYDDWSSRNGQDGSGVQVEWLRYVCKRWSRESSQWMSGSHKGKSSGKKGRRKVENL